MSEIKSYDVIVIGAGCGGLTAAACIAREGKKVLLTERKNAPGGFYGSFVRGRFEFDIASQKLWGANGENASEIQKVLKEIGVSEKINWIKLPSAYRVITKSNSGEKFDITLPFGVENFIEAIDNYCSGSKASLQKVFKIAEETHRALKALSELESNPSHSATHRIMKDYPDFVNTAPYSVDEVLSKLSVPAKARYILEAFWFQFGIDCSRLSFSHFIDSLYSYLTYGGVVPSQKSHALTMALASEIEDNGGEILYNSHVSRIKYKDDLPCGVILKNEKRYNTKHIICNCSPNVVYGKLMKEKDVPESAFKRTNARSFGVRSAVVYLGLNRSPKDLGIKDYETYITSTADTTKQFEQMKKLETNRNFSAICLNIADPKCSPAGTTILVFRTFYTDNCWADIAPEEYFNEKDILAARLIAKYEKATGNTIYNAIEEIEVATPVTFARYTATPQGVTHGYPGVEWDSLLPRFMTEANDCDTKNLRFCGGWGTQLCGAEAAVVSGRNAAFATLEDINEEVRE